MQMIENYFLIIILWVIAMFLIAFSAFSLSKLHLKDKNEKDKKETLFFKIAIPCIILISSIDGSLLIKKNVDKKIFKESVNAYIKEGFNIISNEDVGACQIPNSVIYLDNKGKTSTKDESSVMLCI